MHRVPYRRQNLGNCYMSGHVTAIRPIINFDIDSQRFSGIAIDEAVSYPKSAQCAFYLEKALNKTKDLSIELILMTPRCGATNHLDSLDLRLLLKACALIV